jgi:cardiolipin synthase A/B
MLKYFLIAYFLTWALIPWILLSGKRPESTLAWIWAVLLFPLVGPLAFLLFGVDRVTRERRRKRELMSQKPGEKEQPPMRAGDEPLFAALAGLSEMPTASVREVRVLPNAETFYPALEERIRRAKHHVHIEFFTWEDDDYGKRFRDVLVEVARRGVEVRLLIDRLGSLKTKKEFFEELQKAGGRFAWFRTLNPLRKHFSLHLRNHRKLQIIDGEVAFVGGMNLGKAYMGKDPALGHWRDVQVEVQGSVVASLQQVFVEDWDFAAEEKLEAERYFHSCREYGPHAAQVILGGPDLPSEPMAESTMLLLQHAKKRLWVATGYFAPDARLLSGLRLAGLRGVDVRLLNTKKSDHPYLAKIAHSYYEELMSAGVRIFEYEKGINHAKTMVIDEDLVMVGSANSDDRSMRLNFELNLLMHSAEGARAVEAVFEEDFAESTELDLREFRRRPFRRRLLEAVVRPIAPMT